MWNTTNVFFNDDNVAPDVAWSNTTNVADTAVFSGTGGAVTGVSASAGGVSVQANNYVFTISALTLKNGGISVNSGVTGTTTTGGRVVLGGVIAFTNTDLINFNSTVFIANATAASTTTVTNSVSTATTTLATYTGSNSGGFGNSLQAINGSGNITINSLAAAASNSTPIALTSAASAEVITYSGSGLLTINGNNTLFNNTDATSTVTFRLTSGTLAVGNDNALGALNAGATASGTIFQLNGGAVQATATRSIANNTNLTASSTIGGANALTLSGKFSNSGASSTLTVNNSALTTLSGSVNLANDDITTRTLTIDGAGNTTISAAIANNAAANTIASALTKSGGGTLTLSNNSNSYTGATSVSAGKLVVNGNISTSLLTTVSGTGTLGGSGTVGALTATGGTVSPGNSPGILNAGNTNLQSGSSLAIELAGAAVGTGYDQLNVNGTVTLAGLLNITLSYTPVSNAMFFILNNDSTEAISGVFSNAPTDGGSYTFGGQQFQISYFGDSGTNAFTGGNDVVLMAVPEPASALLGAFGMLALLRRRRI